MYLSDVHQSVLFVWHIPVNIFIHNSFVKKVKKIIIQKNYYVVCKWAIESLYMRFLIIWIKIYVLYTNPSCTVLLNIYALYYIIIFQRIPLFVAF
jgi:hypothetical protein